MSDESEPNPGMNVSVLAGPCSAPPEVRELESGRRLATLAVRVPSTNGRATSVPVTVWEPPAWVETLGAGDPVVVVGRVHRRFFRTATGATGARVEVESEVIAKGGDRRRREALRRRAEGALDALE
ncbi:MAG: single-stranded DNA-binding protein [Actinobacteria bacterium]|nr:single-stranded DNA-binding protein [Actinomycetota bacterium]